MTTPTHDPAIEQEAERIAYLHSATNGGWLPIKEAVLPLLRDLATLRRKAAEPLSDDRLREIEERAAKATKGPMRVVQLHDENGTPRNEFCWQKVSNPSWDSTLIERREDAEFYSNALADIDTLLAALRSRGGEGEKVEAEPIVPDPYGDSSYHVDYKGEE